METDIHRSREGVVASPLFLETPANPAFFPAIVSDSRGKMVVRPTITTPNQILVRHGLDSKKNILATGDGVISGIFSHDPDRLDDFLDPIFQAALSLSRDQKWPNIFPGRRPTKAFEYVRQNSGMKTQPHVCLVPSEWEDRDIKKWMGLSNYDGDKYRGVSRVVRAKIKFPVFCSRPDMVGIFTQFLGGKSSVVVHNVKLGLGLCPQ